MNPRLLLMLELFCPECHDWKLVLKDHLQTHYPWATLECGHFVYVVGNGLRQREGEG